MVGSMSIIGVAGRAAILALALACSTAASAQTCTKEDFETVVDDAAAALRDLTAKNKPEFQEKLRQLKDKRSWSQDQFLKGAAPFVKDAEIEIYEKRSNELLAQISSMGQEGAEAATPDCAMHAELQSLMQSLVESQTAKWTYMFGKLDSELAK